MPTFLKHESLLIISMIQMNIIIFNIIRILVFKLIKIKIADKGFVITF